MLLKLPLICHTIAHAHFLLLWILQLKSICIIIAFSMLAFRNANIFEVMLMLSDYMAKVKKHWVNVFQWHDFDDDELNSYEKFIRFILFFQPLLLKLILKLLNLCCDENAQAYKMKHAKKTFVTFGYLFGQFFIIKIIFACFVPLCIFFIQFSN